MSALVLYSKTHSQCILYSTQTSAFLSSMHWHTHTAHTRHTHTAHTRHTHTHTHGTHTLELESLSLFPLRTRWCREAPCGHSPHCSIPTLILQGFFSFSFFFPALSAPTSPV